MAISLRVEIITDVTVGEVITRVPFILRDILGITSVPPTILKEMANGRELYADAHSRLGSGQAWTLRLEGHIACAYFGSTDALETPAGVVPPAVWVEACASRTPLEYALVAAVAVAVATGEGTNIVDYARFFVSPIETTSEDFVGRTRVRPGTDEIVQAATTFFENLYET